MSGRFKVVSALTIRKRFLVLLAMVLLVFFVMLVATYNTVEPIKAGWNSYLKHVAQRQAMLKGIERRFGYGGAIHDFKNYVLRGQAKYYQRFVDNFQAITHDIDHYRKLGTLTTAEQNALSALEAVARKYRAAADTVQQMYRDGKSPTQIDAAVKINDDPALKAFQLLTRRNKAMTERDSAQLNGNLRHLLEVSIIALSISFLLISAVLFLIGRSILLPIDQLRLLITRAEQDNDLTSRSHLDSADEIGQTAQAFNKMLKKFHTIIGGVSGSTAQLTSAADQLRSVTQQTNEGIKQQQVETEQVASAMSEMAATVQEVARNTMEAVIATQNADREADHGRQVVTQTITAINALASDMESSAHVIQRLEQDSESIGAVLDVIRGITEQTNLLALNAAIEAARAGEQGRGFSVVADEVRTLAQRTQQSTQEIQQMIERLQTGANEAVQVMEQGRAQTNSSVTQAAQAGQSLDAITQAVSTINDINTQIASAAEQQIAVAEEINANVTNISRVAENSAEGAGQTASASDELARLANDMRAMVTQFKV